MGLIEDTIRSAYSLGVRSADNGCNPQELDDLVEQVTTIGQAEHIAALTSMLKEFYWQGMTDAGSQALAMELYERGARAPHGHVHPS